MTTAGGEKLFNESVASVRLTFGFIFLLNALIKTVGFLMCVMTISFALPIDLYKSLWSPENGKFTKTLF